jgi:RNA polymerase sigma-70 factor (ECF subfamily)
MVLPRTNPRVIASREDERDLVNACLRGDTSAFEPIVRTHEGRLYGLLLSLTGDPEEARDLVQDAFVKAWRRLETFDNVRPLGPWLLAVARSCWKDRCRKAYRRMPHLSIHSDALPPLESADGEPDEHVLGTERAELLWEAYSLLPPRDREVLLLKDIQDLPYEQVARVIGIPRGTVASRVYHARRHLRELLGNVEVEISEGAR